jgi:hypothetical protein
MNQSATATAEAIDVAITETVAVATEEAAAAARATAGDVGPGATPARGPTLVPVARALGGPRRRSRADQRWEVTEADLNMYALITGRAPSDAERVAALSGVPNEETALLEAGAGTGGLAGGVAGGLMGGVASRFLSRSRPHGSPDGDSAPNWSPAALYGYLKGVYSFGAHLTQLRVTRPQVAAWVRQVSVEARRRLQETQARLSSARRGNT